MTQRFRMRRAGGVLAAASLLAAGLPVATQATAAPGVLPMQTTDGPVFISEIHYDNVGTDTGEAIEVQAPVGTDLTGWSLVLYNGATGSAYNTTNLTGVVDDTGVEVATYPSNGIQNGEPDGIALMNGSTVVEFLSYEGTFTAVGGPANGVASTDIGVEEDGTEPTGLSLQKIDGAWTGPAPETFDELNSDGADPVEAFISEIHYDNAGTDEGERIEVQAAVGADLSGWSLVLYNGNGGGSYGTLNLGIVGDSGVIFVNAPGLQNGAPDGIALVNGSTVVEFLSYEGAFTATGGPAVGLTSTDIGVLEVGDEPTGLSLQKVGGTWIGPEAHTFGVRNDGAPGDQPPVTTCPGTLVAPFEQGASAPVSAADDNGIGAIEITSEPVTGITLEDVNLATGSAVLTVATSTDPGNYAVTVEFTTDDATPQTAECTVEVSVAHGPLPVSTVQGAGAASPIVGEIATVEGIVTSLFESVDAPDGFFLQEEDSDWDEDPSTSEGLYVFCRGACAPVSVGDQVQVTGRVSEYFEMTQISYNSVGGSIEMISTGNDLPTPVVIDLPASRSTRAAATYESTEGMVVTIPGTLVVSEYFELARYGQLVLTADDRPYQFTHGNLPSVDGYAAFVEDLATRRIILDDNNNNQNDAVEGPQNNEPYPWPQPGLSVDNRIRGGDTIDDLTAVLHWSFAGESGTDAWRLRPIDGVDYTFTSVNPAPEEPEDVGGRLTVTSYNVLNYFATIDTSNNCGRNSNMDCRGADSDIERQRQLAKIAAGLAQIDPDVAGLIEIENDGDDEAVAQIVEALNARTAPGTYDYIETGFIGGDAIKVALVYQPATVTPVGGYAILDSSVNPLFRDDRNRPVLIQTFEENSTGEVFTIAVNHLKSKGSACTGDPDLGDGQGNCNETRVAAVQALMDHLADDPTESGDPDFLIVGDLNSYAMEDPITTLEAAGWTDLHEEFEGPEGYSYVFDGQLGYLDTALANQTLLPQVTGTTAWHINADEVPLFDYNDEFRTADEADFERESNARPLYRDDPLRSSDHDPVIVGLSLGDPAEVVADLRDELADMGIHHGITNALDAKLRAALAAMAEGDTAEACDSLQSFINQVNAQTGKKVTPEQAALLLEEARIARVMLDC